MSCFCHLHLHSTRSRLDGWGTEEQIIKRTVQLGHTAVAVTDHGNVCAHVPLWQAAKKAGVKPIFGCEFYIVDDMSSRTATQETLGVNAFPHVTVIALTQEGYRNLLRLSRMSYQEGFYHYPRIDWDALARCSDGLAVLTGCVGGYPSRLCFNDGPEAAFDFLHKWMHRIERLYVELNPVPGFLRSEQTVYSLFSIAQKLGLPCVLTADAHFPSPEDYRCQDMLLAIGTGRKVDDPTRELKLPSYLYACSVKEITQRLTGLDSRFIDQWDLTKEAIRNTGRLAEEAEVELPRAQPLQFAKLAPAEKSNARLWREVAEGIDRRIIQGLIAEEHKNGYLDRCRSEFDTLDRKGFCDYILIVADLIREIKGRGAVVLTRGSAGGCCLLWAMGASVTDPIKHDLSFERFFDDSRDDPPDIDVDFPPGYRQAAIDYVYATYGSDKCAQLANFNTFQAKAAVKAVATTLGIPLDRLHRVSSALSAGDDDVDAQLHAIDDPRAVEVLQQWPELYTADKFVGQMSNHGIHAAGVIISPTPLDEVIGLMRGKDGQTVSSIDKRGAKALGHLKMDLLSVVALDITARCLQLIDKTPDWLETLPLDDPDAQKVARKLFLAGVFQLDGSAAWRVSKVIGLDQFDDIPVAGSLCRPGPAEWVSVYARNKRNPEELTGYLKSLHERAADIVQGTFGVLVYQEQVMKLARLLANLPWPDVQNLRKGVSDKLGTQPDREKAEAWKLEWKTKFVNGCLSAHHVVSGFGRCVMKEEAEKWWHAIEAHGGYSFNKSHAVTYGLLGYWMFYLKAHYPGEFYAAYLELENDGATRKRLIREFISLGGEVRVLDPVLSRARTYSPRPGLIVGGYSDLYKVGEAGAEKILSKGPFKDWEELLAALTPALRERVWGTGLPTGALDPQGLCCIAPWYPVDRMPSKVIQTRERRGLRTISQLVDPDEMGWNPDPETLLLGFVTSRSITLKHVELFLEDETGGCPVRVSAKNLNKIGPLFRELKLGDVVAINGWWSGDTLYAKGRAVLIRRPEYKPKKKGK